ncbi:hypothetical protein KEM56_007827 [Ascosphaera pollenicola]|nr:hypothetical protein KEM56_007827 [Ascosphaera pollenicola]
MNTPELSGEKKNAEVRRLMGLLQSNTNNNDLSAQEQIKILQELRVYGRNPTDAEPIYCKDTPNAEVSRESLRCLANALLLNVPMRQIFVDLGNGPRVAEKLKNDNSDDEFLASRLLFLTTYETNVDFDVFFDNNSLATSINAHIRRHRKQLTRGRKKKFETVDENALSETLKLVFNITTYYPHRKDALSPSITQILRMLDEIQIPMPPIQSPINYLINSLLNLDLEAKKSNLRNSNVDKLINILDRAMMVHRPDQLELLIIPLLTLLRKIYSIAPEGVQKWMQWLLLPDDDDRDKPLGQSDTLSSRLLKLSTSTVSTQLRETISSLMFELSDSNAERFVRNVGYGFAAGFLVNHNMAVPESAKEAFVNPNPRRKSTGPAAPINPITGQRLDAEPRDRRPPMTQEQKEREAERLFVLFQRLEATGVVKHPVREALEKGRFEELPDSDPED